jgi:hypothetical protein
VLGIGSAKVLPFREGFRIGFSAMQGNQPCMATKKTLSIKSIQL